MNFPIGQSFQRLNDSPLDSYTLFTTLKEAEDFIRTNNSPVHNGQLIHIKDARTEKEKLNGVKVYECVFYVDMFKRSFDLFSF